MGTYTTKIVTSLEDLNLQTKLIAKTVEEIDASKPSSNYQYIDIQVINIAV